MSLIENERTKLLATALNAAATSCFAVGIATPLAGFVYNVSGFRTQIDRWELAIGLACWLIAATSLHLIARRILGGLTNER
jgi:hypothetical protein